VATVIGFIVVLGGLIFFHELGHFTFAKLSGMRVEKFSIGFPPKLFSKKVGETVYQLGIIPFGGFVKVTGVIDESMDDEPEKFEDDPKSFTSKSTLQKLLFISGGVLFNLLLAVLIFSIMTMAQGVDKPATDKAIVGKPIKGYPADSAGIKKGDRILSVDDHKVSSWKDMTDLIHSRPNDSIVVEWKHKGEIKKARLKTLSQKSIVKGKIKPIGMIGIAPETKHTSVGLFSGLGQGVQRTGYWLKVTVVSLKEMIVGNVSPKNLGGPIKIAQMAGQSARAGIGVLFGFMAMLSVNLALLNILPLPALDGGHFIIIIIEGFKGEELSPKTKIRIQKVGMFIILGLMALVFYNDILRLVTGG